MRKDNGSRVSLIEKNIENMAKGNQIKQYVLHLEELKRKLVAIDFFFLKKLLFP